ncbi:MAG: hypothetical protein EBV62_11720, partial [Betaproteobacteria bacterium]|nr:hypothetical protein [Betaproteobacteria bacterium]
MHLQKSWHRSCCLAIGARRCPAFCDHHFTVIDRRDITMFSTFAKKFWLAISVSTFVLGSANAQAQEKVLRIAMTAADIPRTLGQP